MKKASSMDEILKQVEKPGRYLGGEWNEIRKNPLKVKAKVALVFPDLYEIGMSYLGQKILYALLNNHPAILAERVYAPWTDFEQQLRAHQRPLSSLENKIPLDKFDLLGFSLSYELNYTNILTILDLGQIPLLSSERGLKFPLVIGGGPAVFNPEPIAQIFDLFLIGDGEEGFIEIVEKFMVIRGKQKEKEVVLKELSKIKGVYIPSLYETFQPPESHLLAVRPKDGAPARIEKRIFYGFNKASFPEKVVVPNIQAIFNRVAMEVARGCPQKCRFCQALNVYFPYRVKNPSVVVQNMLNSLRSTGYEDASLAALSISDYPYLDEVIDSLMKEFVDQKISLSLSSLRPRGLTSKVAKNIIKVRKTGFTLVPESSTQRLRRVINKNLKEHEIFEASANAFSQGWKLLKLYFMVGIPTERDEDLVGIVGMVEEIIKIGSKILNSPPQINLSVSSFIPKPHTPFQWLKMEEPRILQDKHRFLKSSLKKYPFVRFKDHPLTGSVLEGVYSRGDRRLIKPLLRAWHDGARFDSWNDKFKFSIWEAAFKSEKIDYHSYLAPFSKEALLPWDHIHCGLEKSHLLQELAKALKEESTPSCLDNECGQCQGCAFWPYFEKEFKEKIRIETTKLPSVGKKKDSTFRYRAYYSKLHQACFFSHLDVINIIQRALRRANISVIYSKGFHPKMQLSYLPALPLGMGGRSEVIEFKSEYLYTPKEFVRQMNNFLPSGIKFIDLKKLEKSELSLNESIEKIVYSLDLNSREVIERLQEMKRNENMTLLNHYEIVQKLMERYMKKNLDTSIASFSLDEARKRLYVTVNYSPEKSIRPREIFERIFGIENPVFLLTREKILFTLTT